MFFKNSDKIQYYKTRIKDQNLSEAQRKYALNQYQTFTRVNSYVDIDKLSGYEIKRFSSCAHLFDEKTKNYVETKDLLRNEMETQPNEEYKKGIGNLIYNNRIEKEIRKNRK